MTCPTVLVIADPKAEYLNALQRFSGTVNIIISNQLGLLQEASPKADVILYISDPNLLRAILPQATRLRWVHSFYAGVENILFPEFVASPVILTNARGVYKRPLAEFVMAGILFFAKDIRRLIRNQEMGTWQQFDVEETHGKVMGIVGYGESGRACAELARAFGMRILGLRRRPELSRSDPLLDKVFGADCLVEMLGACDYIVLTAPATPETRRMIGEAEISSMKSQAILINVGRGALVDEAALVRALEGGQIRGAALDVFEVEPLASGHPFYRLKNVLLSPHSTDDTPGWRDHALQCFIRNLEKFVTAQLLENMVDKRAGYWPSTAKLSKES
jgi:phosphoglycerate dehydrogenase-like enzyme